MHHAAILQVRDLLGVKPLAVLVLIRFMADHALREEPGKRFRQLHMTGHAHRAGEEARIEQMQNRVLDAADILVDRQPVIDGGARHRLIGARAAEAREIPRGVDEGVERIGLARCRLPARRARHVFPGRVALERIARLIEADIFRQHDR